jgi:hypothetical protein
MSAVWHQRRRFHDAWTLGDGALGVVAHSDRVCCAQGGGRDSDVGTGPFQAGRSRRVGVMWG